MDENSLVRKIGLGHEQLANEIEELNQCYGNHWRELLLARQHSAGRRGAEQWPTHAVGAGVGLGVGTGVGSGVGTAGQ
jgi:hypothetical protein